MRAFTCPRCGNPAYFDNVSCAHCGTQLGFRWPERELWLVGGGAYRVESWKAGSETILARFDNWKSGPLPKVRRIVARDVPSPYAPIATEHRGILDSAR